MKQDVAMQWADALESGKYKQGTGLLKTKSGNYCCLGVLQEMAASEVSTCHPPVYGDVLLSPQARDWSGIRFPEGQIISQGTSLAIMNDRGDSFSTIAAYIRKHWKAL